MEHWFAVDAGPAQSLFETNTVLNDAGDVSVLTAGPDIHQVECASEHRTISLHVYGADITRTGTSINTIFAPIYANSEPAN